MKHFVQTVRKFWVQTGYIAGVYRYSVLGIQKRDGEDVLSIRPEVRPAMHSFLIIDTIHVFSTWTRSEYLVVVWASLRPAGNSRRDDRSVIWSVP